MLFLAMPTGALPSVGSSKGTERERKGIMRKTLKSPPSWKKIALAVAATSLVLACVWGCAPQTQTAPLAESGDAEATVESPYPDFTERSAGLLPDTYTNRDMLNAGNRGCNTCHADLFDAMNSGNQETGYNHILTHTGSARVAPMRIACRATRVTLSAPVRIWATCCTVCITAATRSLMRTATAGVAMR